MHMWPAIVDLGPGPGPISIMAEHVGIKGKQAIGNSSDGIQYGVQTS